MGVNGALILRQLDEIIPDGEGYKRSIDVTEQIKGSAGAVLTGTTTNAGVGAIETNYDGILCDASGTAVLSLKMLVPRDYDAQKDYMAVRFLAKMGGDTDSAITIDAACFQKEEATALSSDLDPTVSGAINTNTENAGWVEVVADGLGLTPGAGLYWEFTTDAHTSDAIDIYAVEVEYYSDLVYHDTTDRR